MAETRREPRLFVLAGPDLARSFPLGERTTLGRSDECDVVLRDRSISRKHAVLVRQGEAWFVQDLGSTNGISKDGKRVERIELADGDEFRLGDLPLRLRLSVAAVAQEIEFDLGPSGATALALPIPRAPAKAPEAALPKSEVASQGEEVEIEIEGPDAPGAHPARAPLGDSRAATTFRPPRAERRTGLFSGALDQQPLWLRTFFFLVLLALCAGLAYAAFRAVGMLRSGL